MSKYQQYHPFSTNRRSKTRRHYGIKRIGDGPRPCLHPEHSPPKHILLQPGEYEYTCPGCGMTQHFVVPWIVN